MASRIDVARRAGVTPAVVSYVTNGTHPVATATRARVLAAIDELGYRPNALARGLSMSRTHTLGLLLPDSSNPYFAELASAIELAAFDAGFTVLLGNGSADPKREINYVRSFVDRRVDGVIVCPSFDSSGSFEELLASSVPVVVTDRLSHEATLPTVVVDNRGGARMATEHLVEHGRHVIGCISGPHSASPSADRVAGWSDALHQAGMATETAVLAHVDFTVDAGWAATKRLLEERPELDALFVASDLQAMGAMRAITDSGRRVGEDISLVGFDGIQLGEYITPRLTTVVQPFKSIAAAVVSQLLQLIGDDGPTNIGPCVLPTELRIRESCGCAIPSP